MFYLPFTLKMIKYLLYTCKGIRSVKKTVYINQCGITNYDSMKGVLIENKEGRNLLRYDGQRRASLKRYFS